MAGWTSEQASLFHERDMRVKDLFGQIGSRGKVIPRVLCDDTQRVALFLRPIDHFYLVRCFVTGHQLAVETLEMRAKTVVGSQIPCLQRGHFRFGQLFGDDLGDVNCRIGKEWVPG